MVGRSRTYTQEIREKAANGLRALPPKPATERPLSTAETLKQLRPEIQAAIANGYTHEEILEQLKKSGINVGLSTLKSSLKGLKSKAKGKETKPA